MKLIRKRIKKIIIVILFLMMSLVLIKQENMTFKQSILKRIYNITMWGSHFVNKKNAVLINVHNTIAHQLVYNISIFNNEGKLFNLNQYKGKKMLIVNTASDCGFTAQYAELEKLYQLYKHNLVIIAFPSNNFKQQEKGSDETIAQFCKKNYGISFPIMQKSSVIKSSYQNEMFKWLTHSNLNGWNDSNPQWNFTKYLINEQGVLTHVFATSTSPLDEVVIKELN